MASKRSNRDLSAEVRNVEDLDPIVLTRTELTALAERAGNFDDLVRKCYVRILTKTDKVTFYAIYQIIGIIDTYVPIGKSKYSKRLKVDNQAERILESVENSRIEQEEFDAWYKNAKNKDQVIPTLQWVKQRSDQIRNALYKAGESESIKSPEEMEKVLLNREKLLRMLDSTEGIELAEGCFVRMVLGRKNTGDVKYGIAQIIGFEESDSYTVLSQVGEAIRECKVTKKLSLRHIQSAYMSVGIQSISNSPINGDEFYEWSTEYQKAFLPFPVVSFVNRKEQQVKNFLQTHSNNLLRAGPPSNQLDIKVEIKQEVDDGTAAADDGPSRKRSKPEADDALNRKKLAARSL